jgi:hypothetical protein
MLSVIAIAVSSMAVVLETEFPARALLSERCHKLIKSIQNVLCYWFVCVLLIMDIDLSAYQDDPYAGQSGMYLYRGASYEEVGCCFVALLRGSGVCHFMRLITVFRCYE